MSTNVKVIPEIIVCAACQNNITGAIVLGVRHWDELMCSVIPDHHAHEWNRDNHVQGFMTSKGRFVTREEAMVIARRHNQVRRELPGEFNIANLDSSHLY